MLTFQFRENWVSSHYRILYKLVYLVTISHLLGVVEKNCLRIWSTAKHCCKGLLSHKLLHIVYICPGHFYLCSHILVTVKSITECINVLNNHLYCCYTLIFPLNILFPDLCKPENILRCLRTRKLLYESIHFFLRTAFTSN